jgi:hypothetical protein
MGCPKINDILNNLNKIVRNMVLTLFMDTPTPFQFTIKDLV